MRIGESNFFDKHKWLVVALFVILSSAVASLSFPAESVKVTGTFSSLSYNRNSGDLTGEEVRILLGLPGGLKEHYQAVVQFADGVPASAVLVDAEIVGTKVKFRIPEPNPYAGEFVGEVSKTHLTGNYKFTNGRSVKLFLKRGKSYWD